MKCVGNSGESLQGQAFHSVLLSALSTARAASNAFRFPSSTSSAHSRDSHCLLSTSKTEPTHPSSVTLEKILRCRFPSEASDHWPSPIFGRNMMERYSWLRREPRGIALTSQPHSSLYSKNSRQPSVGGCQRTSPLDPPEQQPGSQEIDSSEHERRNGPRISDLLPI